MRKINPLLASIFRRVSSIATLFYLSSMSGLSFAKVDAERRYVYLDEESVAHIMIHPGGSAISFPVKPSKVILGKQKSFDLEYIENDLIIAPLTASGSANLFVYMLGRRFTFHLMGGHGAGDRIIIVKDKRENQLKPSLHE